MRHSAILHLICFISISCGSSHKGIHRSPKTASYESTATDRIDSTREFHGETIVVPGKHRAVSQHGPTYFLEPPRRARSIPKIAPPYRSDQGALTMDEMKRLFGEPDYIDRAGSWHYWGSDEGQLLKVNHKNQGSRGKK